MADYMQRKMIKELGGVEYLYRKNTIESWSSYGTDESVLGIVSQPECWENIETGTVMW